MGGGTIAERRGVSSSVHAIHNQSFPSSPHSYPSVKARPGHSFAMKHAAAEVAISLLGLSLFPDGACRKSRDDVNVAGASSGTWPSLGSVSYRLAGGGDAGGDATPHCDAELPRVVAWLRLTSNLVSRFLRDYNTAQINLV